MIATHVTVCCERFSYANGPVTCTAKPLEFGYTPTAQELAVQLSLAGYVTRGGEHYCPWHADQGERFEVAVEWREIAPGVMVRIPRPWGSEEIEVKRVAVDG